MSASLDETLYEREFFLKSRLLHLWLAGQIDALLHSSSADQFVVKESDISKDLRFIKHACLRILSCPIVQHRERKFSSALQALLRAVPQYFQSNTVRNKAQQRLLKRPANFFAGWLGRIIRTPAQIPFYQQLSTLYNGLAGTDRLDSIDDVFVSLHGIKDEDESGFLRRAFLEMVDLLLDESRKRGGGAYILACFSSVQQPEKLPDVFGVAIQLTEHTVAKGFIDFYEQKNSYKQARRAYQAVPWRTLVMLTSLTGPRLSAAIVDIIISVSFGGHSLFDRLMQWAVSLDVTLLELEDSYRCLEKRELSIIIEKLRNIVRDHYPMSKARDELNDRETLEALLVCDIVQPPVNPQIVDAMTNDDFAEAYSCIMLLLELYVRR